LPDFAEKVFKEIGEDCVDVLRSFRGLRSTKAEASKNESCIREQKKKQKNAIRLSRREMKWKNRKHAENFVNEKSRQMRKRGEMERKIDVRDEKHDLCRRNGIK